MGRKSVRPQLEGVWDSMCPLPLQEEVGVDVVTECVCGCDTKCMSPCALLLATGTKNYANKWTERQKKQFHNNLRICNTQIKESRDKPEAHLYDDTCLSTSLGDMAVASRVETCSDTNPFMIVM